MAQSFIDETFGKKDFTEHPLPKGEYDGCIFTHCNFSGTDLSSIHFIDCEFIDSNLSMAKVPQVVLRDIKFQGCKMLGLHFEDCNEFGLAVSFENCILNHSSFYRRKLKKTIFKGTQLREVDLTEADLTQSVFDACDLLNAKFDHTLLEKADLRTAINYSIDPTINKIKKARFSLTGLPGLLDKYDIDITP